MKAVPGSGVSPGMSDDGTRIVNDGDAFVNESDDYALEQALMLKRNVGGKVTAITLGTVKSQDILHTSLAKGADDAIRIDADEFDPNIVSFLLARALKNLNADLILTGVESADGMASQVPMAIAARLGMPCVYAVTRVEWAGEDQPLVLTRELGGGRSQTLEVDKPALLCVQAGIVPLTYAPVVKLIHARRKGIPSLKLNDLEITADELAARRKTKVTSVQPVEKNSTTQWLTGSVQAIATQIMEKIVEAR
jgi:electron transfer flavoprotein beta subunit